MPGQKIPRTNASLFMDVLEWKPVGKQTSLYGLLAGYLALDYAMTIVEFGAVVRAGRYIGAVSKQLYLGRFICIC